MNAISRYLNLSTYSSNCKEFLELILTQNYFLFEDDLFLQIKGTAMGSIVALTYANLYMAFLKEIFIYRLDTSVVIPGGW